TLNLTGGHYSVGMDRVAQSTIAYSVSGTAMSFTSADCGGGDGQGLQASPSASPDDPSDDLTSDEALMRRSMPIPYRRTAAIPPMLAAVKHPGIIYEGAHRPIADGRQIAAFHQDRIVAC